MSYNNINLAFDIKDTFRIQRQIGQNRYYQAQNKDGKSLTNQLPSQPNSHGHVTRRLLRNDGSSDTMLIIGINTK